MFDGQEQSCPEGPGMTPLMASYKEAGAMVGSGRDGLNLCKGAGGGTAALAKTARPSAAFPPGWPEVSRTAQPSALPMEAGFEISVKKKIRSFSTEISLKFH